MLSYLDHLTLILAICCHTYVFRIHIFTAQLHTMHQNKKTVKIDEQKKYINFLYSHLRIFLVHHHNIRIFLHLIFETTAIYFVLQH